MIEETTHLPLQRAYYWEQKRGDHRYMTQPIGGGAVQTFTWAQAMDQARRMAAYLRAQDFPPGSRIAILSNNCAHFIMTDLAIWMAGHVSVALYPTLGPDTMKYILDHSGARLLFVGKLDAWDRARTGVPEDLPCVCYPLSPPNDLPTWSTIIEEHAPLAGTPTRDPDDVAMLIYTSGSTGRPKGVMVTFGTMAFVARGAAEVLGFSSDDRQLSYLPLAHSFERAMVENGTLHDGGQVFFTESLDTFVEDLRRARPTVFHSVPRLWLRFQQGVFSKIPPRRLQLLLRIPLLSRLLKRKILRGLGLADARMAISGSAPIPAELIQWYRDLGLELLEGYAMTENFAYSHCSRPGHARAGTVGHPFPGVECKLSDQGEILVKSEATMAGYYRLPEVTAAAFTEDGFLRTGDRGVIDAQGRLQITGRIKELFKTSKGKYIAPAPIENLLNASELVEQSCVTGSGHPMAHAVVMLAEEAHRQLGEPSRRREIARALTALLDRVNEHSEKHEALAFLVVAKDPWMIDNGLLTPTLKIKRGALERTYGPKSDGWYATGGPVIWET